ncbi:MAG: hypothetical protein Q9178_002872 [Gyalolechia marmorata]
MKYTITIVSLLTLLSTSTAQSLNDIPACASEAALSSFTNSGCTVGDNACICRNQDFLSSLLPVVEANCSPEEVQRTVEFTTNFCRGAGVTLDITTSGTPSPTATDSASSSTVAASTATASNGSLTPGNNTQGGAPQSPDPSPQPAPDSGVAGSVALARDAGILGMILVGAVMVL